MDRTLLNDSAKRKSKTQRVAESEESKKENSINAFFKSTVSSEADPAAKVMVVLPDNEDTSAQVAIIQM